MSLPYRTIYILEAHERIDLEGMQDADLVLILEDSGYQGGARGQLMHTDAGIRKDRDGFNGDGNVVTVIQNWPSKE